MRIGLLGGSFDPAHAGHLLISRIALRRLGLDRVWWLMSPGNPLKSRQPASFERRAVAAAEIIGHRRDIIATDLERHLQTRYTHETLGSMIAHYPGVDFVWMMGADNLVQIDHWRAWEQIFETMPIVVFSRPGLQLRAGLSKAARRFAYARLPPYAAMTLPTRSAPCWTLLLHPLSGESSTAHRAAGGWP